MTSGRLILLRHGESTANAAGLFTGALDVPLTERGRWEAAHAAALLGSVDVPELVFSSEMMRAIETAWIVAPERTVVSDWRLNERSYGSLTGRSKAEVLAEYGPDLFLDWRRSVQVAPPPMVDALYRELRAAPLYRRLPAEALKHTETLRDVISRVGAFFEEMLLPALGGGLDVLAVAHGNSLRALCAVLECLGDAALRELNIPTGHPLVYMFDDQIRPIVPGGVYLDESAARSAAAVLATEGGT